MQPGSAPRPPARWRCDTLEEVPSVHRLALFLTAAALVLTPFALGATSAATTGTFTYGTYTDVMVGWDPSTSYSNEILAMQNMYETLTRYDSRAKKIKPLLATSVAKSKDGKTWTFTLRKGVT